MTIDWIQLFIALALLWLPRQVMRKGQRHHRHASRSVRRARSVNDRQPGDFTVGFAEEFSKPRNYIDLVRGWLGSVALTGSVPGISPAIMPAEGAPEGQSKVVMAVIALILTIAVVIQACRLERRMSFYAPIFFLGGLSLGVCGPVVALFAWVLAWTVNLSLPNPMTFLLAYSGLIGAFSALFIGRGNLLAYAVAALCFLPGLVSLLARRPLVVFSKRAKTA